eukprot:scaffold113543_cov51-Attheya_sp.AAC.2
MGGEWIFRIEPGVKPSTSMDLNRYHRTLQNIKTELEKNPSSHEPVIWSDSIAVAKETNVFATFSYACARDIWDETSGASWKIFWDPRKVIDSDYSSDIHARCFPVSASKRQTRRRIQKRLIREFPSIFRLDIRDGISGHYDHGARAYEAEEKEEFTPYTGALSRHSYRYGASNAYEAEEEEEFTPSTGMYFAGNGDRVWAHQGEDQDYTACGSDCGNCGRCQY